MVAKLTYAEQLKHPNWQRKRLEMLDAAGFECACCGDKETTLHVHHRQYIKGRMAWEYENTQLEVLCEACHKVEHQSLDGMKQLMSEVTPSPLFALASGYHHHTDWIDRGVVEMGRQTDALAYAAGLIAWLAYQLGDIDQMDQVAAFAASLMNENSEGRMVYVHSSAKAFGRGD